MPPKRCMWEVRCDSCRCRCVTVCECVPSVRTSVGDLCLCDEEEEGQQPGGAPQKGPRHAVVRQQLTHLAGTECKARGSRHKYSPLCLSAIYIDKWMSSRPHWTQPGCAATLVISPWRPRWMQNSASPSRAAGGVGGPAAGGWPWQA
jgi:hypothetical protein